MPLAIHLLGRPVINPGDPAGYRLRSRKSWAVLAYLLLRDQEPGRSELAELLFSEADDPLRALRWSLSEVRRGLGGQAVLEGDPVVLSLPDDAVVDVEVVTRGEWADAVVLPGFGEELLAGTTISDAAAFESWLLAEQRHLAASTEAILHEAALSALSQGLVRDAIDHGVALVGMNPYDENHQALLIRLYRAAGDVEAAAAQRAACETLFSEELGVAPGPGIAAAMREPVDRQVEAGDDASIEAVLEAGAAAVAAGAVEPGVQSLRTAVGMADGAGSARLRITARLALAEALIHSLRGEDEEGTAALHMAIEVAERAADNARAAEARTELGYVDFLRARYDRAERWFADVLSHAGGSSPLTARAATFLGSVQSDRADYPSARRSLGTGIDAAVAAGDVRREAYGVSMVGRLQLLQGDLDGAGVSLDRAIALADDDRWLAFLPWPQALRGEVDVALGDPEGAGEILTQAFARACQLGDPCWEGLAARALALAAEASGDTNAAFAHLSDARARCNRLADPYVWLDVYILDAQSSLGLLHGHPDTADWIAAMYEGAARHGMRELVVRALVHRAAIDAPTVTGHLEAARLLQSEIDNPALARLVSDADSTP